MIPAQAIRLLGDVRSGAEIARRRRI